MSDSTPIEPPTRWLKSPFNGEAWPVPPTLTPQQYDHMVAAAGFVPIEAPQPKKAKRDR